MKKSFLLLFAIVLLMLTPVLLAQAQPASGQAQTQAASQPAQPQTVSSVMDRRWSGTEKQFTDLADAMPEDKYGFAPTQGEFKGVRNFGSQVKHVAAGNYEYGAAILQEKPPVDTGGEDGPENIKTKADIMKYLRDSFAYMHRAMKSLDEKNLVESIKPPFGSAPTTRLAVATGGFTHVYDHYGQLVEYLRMNSIIPPASRPRPRQ